MMDYKIYPLGESAVTIDFGNVISKETNDIVTNLSKHIQQNNFEGYIECVPAYSSLTIFYDVYIVRNNESIIANAFESIKNFIETSLHNLSETENLKSKTHEIPVLFKKEFAPDLEFVAKTNNLVEQEVINIFLSRTYRIFMLGFLPGFAYMGEIDQRIATRRKQTPRTRVPKGSVGIAGMQTGIYPLASPGGWQIIGRTDAELFTPQKTEPTLFDAGDLVKFIEV